MQEGADLLDHINKVKALADQLACLEVPVRDEDVVMTLLESLPPSYEHHRLGDPAHERPHNGVCYRTIDA